MRTLVNHRSPLSRLSLYDHQQACSSHTNESESKPRHAPQGIDALPAEILPISGLADRLQLCSFAYPEAGLHSAVKSFENVYSAAHALSVVVRQVPLLAVVADYL